MRLNSYHPHSNFCNFIFRRSLPNNYPPRFTVYDLWVGAKKTEIQIIVTTDITEEDGADYTRDLLSTFDLDFCRMAIYCDEYVKVLGGLDTLRVFFDDKLRNERGLARNNSYTKKTLSRAKKYVSRLNYDHFAQFAIPLEDMSLDMYQDIISNREYAQPVSQIKIINEE